MYRKLSQKRGYPMLKHETVGGPVYVSEKKCSFCGRFTDIIFKPLLLFFFFQRSCEQLFLD